MKLRALVFCLGLALVGCAEPQQASAPTQPGGPDPAAMSAAISRYGIMLEEISRLTSERPGSSEAAPTEPTEIARGLRETVWAYNIERSRLCGRGLFRDIACGPAFEPVWINEPMGAAPSLEILAERQAAVDALVVPFWSAVCADARSRQVVLDAGLCVVS